jgi:hypothetical protein
MYPIYNVQEKNVPEERDSSTPHHLAAEEDR